MYHAVHHFAGRLRLKYPQLRRHPARARAVTAALRAAPGIRTVTVNEVTGSLLVHYDDRAICGNDVIALVNHAMDQEATAALPSRSFARTTSHSGTLPLLDKATDILIEKCVERALVMLVGVLL